MIDTGTFGGRFGYLRFGGGPRTLVVLPGMYVDGETPGGLAVRAYGWGFRALMATHTVHVVRRPGGLPAGTSTAAACPARRAAHRLPKRHAGRLQAELAAFLAE